MTLTFDVVDAVPASASAAGDLIIIRARFYHSLIQRLQAGKKCHRRINNGRPDRIN